MALVPAASRLMAQVEDADPDVKVEVVDEVDGLGFQRVVKLSGKGSKRIITALEAMRDPRIDSIKSGRVTFVADTRADFAHDFPLAEVLAVLDE